MRKKYTWNMSFLLNKSSFSLEICSVKELCSSTNLFLWKCAKETVMRQTNDPIKQITLTTRKKMHLIKPDPTSKEVSFLKVISNKASACFSDKWYSAYWKETKFYWYGKMTDTSDRNLGMRNNRIHRHIHRHKL